MKRIFSRFLVIVLLTATTACDVLRSAPIVLVSGGAHTWFDAPLDGSNLPLAPYPVVIHAYDPSGVVQVELSVNGVVLENLKSATGPGLTIIKYSWVPKQTGNFVLRARSQGQGEAWNSEATTRVIIGEFSPTLVSSSTPTPVSSFTPTPVISITPTPVPSSKLTFKSNVSTSQIYYGGCGVAQVTLQAYVSDTVLVRSVTVFINLKDQNSGQSTGWDGGETMNPAGNGWFQRTVPATSIPNYNSYANSWILYQFVATDSKGVVVGRSPVYSNVALSGCAAPPQRVEPPPVLIITMVRPKVVPPKIPTKTFIPSPK